MIDAKSLDPTLIYYLIDRLIELDPPSSSALTVSSPGADRGLAAEGGTDTPPRTEGRMDRFRN